MGEILNSVLVENNDDDDNDECCWIPGRILCLVFCVLSLVSEKKRITRPGLGAFLFSISSGNLDGEAVVSECWREIELR